MKMTSSTTLGAAPPKGSPNPKSSPRTLKASPPREVLASMTHTSPSTLGARRDAPHLPPQGMLPRAAASPKMPLRDEPHQHSRTPPRSDQVRQHRTTLVTMPRTSTPP